jgi:hypothetical protein
MRSLLIVRTLFAVGFIVFGVIVFFRLVVFAPQAGFRIVPGVVLALAMVALGVHRIVLVLRLRNT